MEAMLSNKLWTKEYILALIISFMISISMNMLFSTIALYGRGLSGSDVYAGLLATVFTLAALASRGFMGMIFRHFSLKEVLLLGALMTLAAAIGYLFWQGLTALLFWRMVHGVGFGIASTAGATVISSSVPRTRMLEGVGYSGLSMVLAMAIGPSMGLSLCQSDWQLYQKVFVANLGLGLLLLGGVCLLKIKPLAQEEQLSEQEKARADTVWKAIIIFFVMLGLIMAFAQSSVSTLLSVYALDKKMGNVSMFFLVYAGAVIASRLFLPKISKRVSEKNIIIACFVGLSLCFIAIAVNNTAYILFLIAIPYGFTGGLLSPILQVKILQKVTVARQGSANALYYAAFDGGIGLGALTWSSIGGAVGYVFVYLLSGVLAAAGAVIYFQASRKNADTT